MPWFWGKSEAKAKGDSEDEEEYSSSSYADDSEDEEESLSDSQDSSYSEGSQDGDNEDHEHPHEYEEDDDGDDGTTMSQESSTVDQDQAIKTHKGKEPSHPRLNGHTDLPHGDSTTTNGNAATVPVDDRLQTNLSSNLSFQSTSTSAGDISFVDSESYKSEEEEDDDDDDDGYDENNAHNTNLDDMAVSPTIDLSPDKMQGISEDSSGGSQEGDHLSKSSSHNGRDQKSLCDDTQKVEASQSSDSGEDENENEEGPTTFYEKQSLIALAAEHDRVDILKGILDGETTGGADDNTQKDDNYSKEEERQKLLSSGIPPLHLAIHFGSINTTQSLLRMGADPSIRPNVEDVKRQAQEAPEGQQLQIPNIQKFDEISAWELAFGNPAYEEQQKSRSAWSMFNASSSNIGSDGDRIIKPVDMPPSKREGIRHAFTAEALRCIGADEVQRLTQLLDSGMPASIDIGGKDLYHWAVQLGGLKCEELLRPVEAAKYGNDANVQNTLNIEDEDETEMEMETVSLSSIRYDLRQNEECAIPGKVIDRPGTETTIPLLINRLDELESLASALSTCLDNLAEEVSVCHGLLLMGGGATALASHVKSLKSHKVQKQDQFDDTLDELKKLEQELARAVKASGKIGEEVLAMDVAIFTRRGYFDKTMDVSTEEKKQKEKELLLAQIAACENKILKLRASIADLSEENAKELKEVEDRGLSGGINLVRTLRDELRETDFQLDEVKNRMTTGKAQLSLIRDRLPKKVSKKTTIPEDTDIPTLDDLSHVDNAWISITTEGTDLNETMSDGASQHSLSRAEDEDTDKEALDHSSPKVSTKKDDVIEEDKKEVSLSGATSQKDSPQQLKVDNAESKSASMDRRATPIPGHLKQKKEVNSERIATGNSDALVVRPTGRQGFMTLDLWQVILRIVGLNQAANRRAAKAVQKTKGTPANLMLV